VHCRLLGLCGVTFNTPLQTCSGHAVMPTSVICCAGMSGRPLQAVLLVGFMPQEVDDFRALMNDMDADIVKVGRPFCCYCHCCCCCCCSCGCCNLLQQCCLLTDLHCQAELSCIALFTEIAGSNPLSTLLPPAADCRQDLLHNTQAVSHAARSTPVNMCCLAALPPITVGPLHQGYAGPHPAASL
jgi:hypothetical protein